MMRRQTVAFLSLTTMGISALYAAQGCVGVFDFIGAVPTRTAWWRLAWQAIWPWPPWIIGAPLVAWLAVRWSIIRCGLVRFIVSHLMGAAALLLFLSFAYQPWALSLFAQPKPEESPPSARFEDYGEDPAAKNEGSVRSMASDVESENRGSKRSLRPAAAASESEERVTYVPSANLTILLWNLLYFSLLATINQGLLAFVEMGRQKAENAALRGAVDRARLSALQKQLNPHFLFNVLNSICYIATRDPHSARDMLLRLSTLLRSSFDADETERSAHTEIELTRSYIELCRLRYGDRLRVDWHVAPDLKAERLPTLSLQTLVENAVVHAVEKTAAPVTVEIRITRSDAELRVEINDDGPGCGSDSGGYREGVGLGNLRQRMGYLYGDRAALVIVPGRPRGFRVAMSIPRTAQSSVRG